MKRPFLFFLETLEQKDRREIWLWLFFHLGIPVLFLFSLFLFDPVKINTSLFDMLPQSRQSRAVIEADKTLASRNGREALILAAAADFQSAKKGAALLYEEFKNSPAVEKASFYFDSEVMADFNRYLFDYRFVIAGSETLELLENGSARSIADDALASAFGAFNFYSLDNVEKDPFFLAERRMGDFLSSSLLAGKMSLRDEVLASSYNDVWHVMLRLTLAPDAVSLKADKNIVGKIYAAANSIKDVSGGLRFYFSGVPFHSYESSSGAQKEISLISTITFLLILFIFLYTFRSPLPVVFSVAAIVVSLGIAAVTALLVFREIHIITFVFGTTLIGTCVDYSVHFFVNWKRNRVLKNGAEIRSHIIKNVTMSFISTQICFVVFLFAPFPLLKQFAVFSMAGLLSSYLTFFCIYPRLKVPPENTSLLRRPVICPLPLLVLVRVGSWLKNHRHAFFAILIIGAGAVLVINSSAVKIENNISSLYKMSAFMLESEKQTALAMGYGSSGWYYIVSGASADETLENEERLVLRLEEERAKGNLEACLASAFFVPSLKTQKRTYKAMEALLPLARLQFEQLGFQAEYADAFEKEFAAARYCHVEDAPSNAGLSNLWIGKLGDNYFSCVMPIKPVNEAVFRSIAEGFENVHFINKAKDIGRDLDTITKTMLFLFLSAYIVVSVIIFFMYRRRDSFKICAVPLLLVIAALAALAAGGIPIGFFSVAALILVFGLSLDYIFFMTGQKSRAEKNLTLLGVTLSFLTTLLSFGALALSSFMPVHLFGLTVSAGLGAAFIFAMFDNNDKPI